MCGIAGMINLKNEPLREKEHIALDHMLGYIKHRGPDDLGVCAIEGDGGLLNKTYARDLCNSRGLLGFVRLSIQDISVAGHQPMMSPDNMVVITFNGEIYNVDELRKKLEIEDRFICWKGHSDTEVILQLYIHYGFEETIKMLNGMFAIVLYDVKCKKMFIARDRFGIVPLYITYFDNKLFWSSEMKAFMALEGFKREINERTLSEDLFYIYPTAVLYKNVDMVEPGMYMEVDLCGEGEVLKYKFFDINQYIQWEYLDGNAFEKANGILQESVKRQLISDVPLGVQFSGGIDSTLVAKYASDCYRDRRKKLYGFSLVNTQYQEYDESSWIDVAASNIEIGLKRYNMTKELFFNNFEKSLFAFERVISVPSPMGIYEFSKHASKEVTVLLSGEGADELCGGYDIFPAYKFTDTLYKMTHNPKYMVGDNFFKGFDSQYNEERCKELYSQFSVEHVIENRKEMWNGLDGTTFDKIRKMYFKGSLIVLLERQNKICMANSVENRVPFLDNDMVDLMFSVPEKYLVKPQYMKAVLVEKQRKAIKAYEGKYILKELSKKIYGKEFAYRDKQAIRVPLSQYIKSDLFREYIQEYILPGIKTRGILDAKRFECMYNHLEEGDNAMGVWKAMNIEAWNQLFIDGRTPL